MGRLRCLCVFLAAAAAITVDAQGPQILAAQHIDPTRVSASFEDFPWRDAAPAAIRNLEGSVPDAARRAELAKLAKLEVAFGIELDFDVPVPNRVRSRHYLLIHAGGATPLRIDALAGTGRLDLPDPGQPIPTMVFYGDLRAVAANNHTVGGGFVFIDDRPRTATVAPSRHTADELMGPGGKDYFARGTAFWNVRARFTFTLDGDKTRYVFVQWAADTDVKEGGCEHRFSLFRLEPAPVQIASSNYGCDV